MATRRVRITIDILLDADVTDEMIKDELIYLPQKFFKYGTLVSVEATDYTPPRRIAKAWISG